MDEYDEADVVTVDDLDCPACHSTEATLLGTLGRRTYYRCRCCGMDFGHHDPAAFE